MLYKSLKGFRDILPDEAVAWRYLEETIHALAARYGYGEVRMPIVEATELFRRGVGEGTDIVGKEMYSFDDKSDPPESITLRPELTAGAARAFIEHETAKQSPLTRWYYVGPMFRYEQPQAGRYRQFSQFGLEIYGSAYPHSDAEVIIAGIDLLHSLGITNFRLRLNSIGTAEERTSYRAVLLDYLRGCAATLSPESQARMERNPLRVLDSKREEDIAATAGAPSILDFLAEESQQHFATVRALLDEAGIGYVIDTRLVRGLDYYTRTAFEYQGMDLGAQDALGGGGRYDGLIGTLGGGDVPAVGLSFGMDRLLIAIGNAGLKTPPSATPDVYIVGLGSEVRPWVFSTAHRLRRQGCSVQTDLLGRSMKAQMRDANRSGARMAIIVGSNELAERVAGVKNLASGEQQSIPFDNIEQALLLMR